MIELEDVTKIYQMGEVEVGALQLLRVEGRACEGRAQRLHQERNEERKREQQAREDGGGT